MDMKLAVQTSTGYEIPVTKETLIGFKDNNELLTARREMLASSLEKINRKDEKYISPNKEYIFTNDLKSLSGTILHKIVFSFKLAYIRLIRDKTGMILPIVLDSPTGREVKHSTIEEMLHVIQRDYSDHQLFVASIYDYDLRDKKIIEFTDGLFSSADMIGNG